MSTSTPEAGSLSSLLLVHKFISQDFSLQQISKVFPKQSWLIHVFGWAHKTHCVKNGLGVTKTRTALNAIQKG